MARVGADRVLVGTDYPFPIAENPVGLAVDEAGLPDDQYRAVLSGNARALFPT